MTHSSQSHLSGNELKAAKSLKKKWSKNAAIPKSNKNLPTTNIKYLSLSFTLMHHTGIKLWLGDQTRDHYKVVT